MGAQGYNKNANATYIEETVFVIDAGHGGEDPGADANGLIEKDLNLEISKLLNPYLNFSGYDTVMTREEDVLLYDPNISGSRKKQDLKNRIKIANERTNSVLISIHMNKFPLEYCAGLQTFYSKNEESFNLAQAIQTGIKSIQPENDRRVKDGSRDIYILQNSSVPAVLIECGFLSNNRESALLKTDDYKNALAFSIYYAIAEHKEIKNEI